MATPSSILVWEIHRQRSLVGYSPRAHKEPYTTERLSTHTHTHTNTQNKIVTGVKQFAKIREHHLFICKEN